MSKQWKMRKRYRHCERCNRRVTIRPRVKYTSSSSSSADLRPKLAAWYWDYQCVHCYKPILMSPVFKAKPHDEAKHTREWWKRVRKSYRIMYGSRERWQQSLTIEISPPERTYPRAYLINRASGEVLPLKPMDT